MVKFSYGSSYYCNNIEITGFSKCITSSLGAFKHSHPSWIFSCLLFLYMEKSRSPISICDACHKPDLIQWYRYFSQLLCVLPISNDPLAIYLHARRNPIESHNSCERILQHPTPRNHDVQPYHNTDTLKKTNPKQQNTQTQKHCMSNNNNHL